MGCRASCWASELRDDGESDHRLVKARLPEHRTSSSAVDDADAFPLVREEGEEGVAPVDDHGGYSREVAAVLAAR